MSAKTIWCRIVGHRPIRVSRQPRAAARPGGMLPSIDGYITYSPDPDGYYLACSRCRRVPIGRA